MPPFTSKELFRMNGGQKIYIHLDGFGDVYSATAQEEEEWSREMITEAIDRLESGKGDLPRSVATERLVFFNSPGISSSLIAALKTPDLQELDADSFHNMIKTLRRLLADRP
ncbi:MAG: hypothetical protein EOO09_14715 [Chitinophagaceae bacterium]|nr:MAG: hypothetical protein EOO09_14715 [Chitinophagaceae bacterium]